MNERARIALVATTAFLAGLAVARLPQPAGAAAAPVTPQSVDVMALTPDAYPPANPKLPGVRTKPLVVTDAMVISSQILTDAPKHTHANAGEYQVVVSGSGTEWLDDKQVPLKPGTFVAIPPGTVHGGLTGGPFTFVTVKSPPQDPADYHMVP